MACANDEAMDFTVPSDSEDEDYEAPNLEKAPAIQQAIEDISYV